MVAYADTSFLFSLYAQDANTARAARAAGNGGVTFLLTDFQRYELRNALRLSVFRGHLPGLTCQRLLQQVADDLDQGVFLAVPLVWGQVFAEADGVPECGPHRRAWDSPLRHSSRRGGGHPGRQSVLHVRRAAGGAGGKGWIEGAAPIALNAQLSTFKDENVETDGRLSLTTGFNLNVLRWALSVF